MRPLALVVAVALFGCANAQTVQSEAVQFAQMRSQYRTNQMPGQPRESNFEESPFSEVDNAPSPERKLGEILKRDSVMGNTDNCQPSLPYRAREACVEKGGATFVVQYPADCKISIEMREQPLVVQKRWDGSIGSTLVGRQITFDLRTLKEDKISVSPLLELYFQISKSKMPTIRVAMSGDPDKWITLPSPPLEEDFANFPDRARGQALDQAIFQWSKEIASYGRLPHDRQSFELSPHFFRVTTQAMAGLWFSQLDGGALSRAAQDRLVDILKSILAKCHE